MIDISFGYTHLTIVKCSFNSNIMYISISDSCHLRFLDWRDATFWMQNKDGDVGLIPKSIDGSTTVNELVRWILID